MKQLVEYDICSSFSEFITNEILPIAKNNLYAIPCDEPTRMRYYHILEFMADTVEDASIRDACDIEFLNDLLRIVVMKYGRCAAIDAFKLLKTLVFYHLIRRSITSENPLEDKSLYCTANFCRLTHEIR